MSKQTSPYYDKYMKYKKKYDNIKKYLQMRRPTMNMLKMRSLIVS